MAQPKIVAEAVATMQAAVRLPITVKHRLGIDDRDRYEDMAAFVDTVAQAGCQRFIVHARKAWLKGLSPKENRTVPPLRYQEVHRLKQEFPQLCIEINGGIVNLKQAQEQLQWVDGVMIGRAAYDKPFLLATVDRDIYGDNSVPVDREAVVEAMLPYIDRWIDKGGKLNHISRHLLELFAGERGSKIWKRHLGENAYKLGAGSQVIRDALSRVQRFRES